MIPSGVFSLSAYSDLEPESADIEGSQAGLASEHQTAVPDEDDGWRIMAVYDRDADLPLPPWRAPTNGGGFPLLPEAEGGSLGSRVTIGDLADSMVTGRVTPHRHAPVSLTTVYEQTEIEEFPYPEGAQNVAIAQRSVSETDGAIQGSKSDSEEPRACENPDLVRMLDGGWYGSAPAARCLPLPAKKGEE